MAPTILVAGATGNTGRSVVETLSKLLKSSKSFSNHRILALTRSQSSPAAQKLAQLPHVEVAEQNWVEITPDWLREQSVVRAFIAPHLQPNQFAEESTFHVAALQAGVQYVVRISTAAPNVRPDYTAYYPRSHWAIEAMLGTPEFARLQWTSLQPNGFAPFILMGAAELIKQYRKTGTQGTLSLLLAKDAPVALIDPDDVGTFAAHLLLAEDTAPHNKAKYVLNGPEDISGEQIVELVEKRIGAKVENVVYKDMSFVDQMVAASQESKNVISSIKTAGVTMWEGKCTASTTSQAVLEIAAPKRTPEDVLKSLLDE
ncbi:NAD(P)-binding protein [Lophiostoma macrostomum CBS 122681]|uniref:NAD(P)-binding protein n=1 Tax=Lophiostoma macrostomum CBS 122681 TaxID=1314788 RepID=A0A6A6T100_9PLEO|nr:NAD(P)-binding protein [Lophiostoma macrostomum CBS 122681]